MPVLSDQSNRRRQYRGQQFGWRYAAAHLRCRGGPRRCADHQIGRLGHIDASFGQSSDDTDRPCMSGGSTTTKNQSNAFGHLPPILAQGHFCSSTAPQLKHLWVFADDKPCADRHHRKIRIGGFIVSGPFGYADSPWANRKMPSASPYLAMSLVRRTRSFGLVEKVA